MYALTITFNVNDFQYCDLVNQRRKYYRKSIHTIDFGKLFVLKQLPISNNVAENIEVIQFDNIQFISNHITLNGFQCTFSIKSVSIQPDNSALNKLIDNPSLKGFSIWYELGELISFTKKTDYTMND